MQDQERSAALRVLAGVKGLFLGGSFTMFCSVHMCGLTSGSSNTQTFCLGCMRCQGAASGCCTALYLIVGTVSCLVLSYGHP